MAVKDPNIEIAKWVNRAIIQYGGPETMQILLIMMITMNLAIIKARKHARSDEEIDEALKADDLEGKIRLALKSSLLH